MNYNIVTENKKNNSFNQSMTLFGRKLKKITNGNATTDKESIIELVKVVFEKEFEKQQQEISKIISSNLIIMK